MRFIFFFLVSATAFSKDLMEYYLPSYDDSRTEFRELAEKAKLQFNGTETGKIDVPSKKDKDLTLDTLYVPASKKNVGLVVIVSGVHGSEAFAGTAVQRMLLERFLLAGKFNTEETGFLFLHVVNPYGFRHNRRVSENNVDLNRNFINDKKVFKTKNDLYAKLDPLLNPQTPANAGWINHVHFLLGTLKTLASGVEMKALNQAIGQGQYHFEKGIMFGGTDFEPQKDPVEKLLLKKAEKYSKVFILDLHTGYGKRGYMHLLPNPPDTKQIAERWKLVFGDYRIETTINEKEKGGDEKGKDEGNFYSNEGDFSTFSSRLLENKKRITVPMLIEFGTMNSHETYGGVAQLSRLILENQAVNVKPRSERDMKIIQKNFREMFFPSAKNWRKQVMDQSEEHIPKFIENFQTKL